ncbi:hypothetical protein GOEFS_044_00140 [Gordonia effusa NBRC 100432]|uniref:Uncharacterized protein n=1 Tax=Gordonia effusa NBRC 100432 TaxID=1077974 RepID=H0QYS7_9ACTN|nr:hypothetical protein [Gordonia effusa]GAB17978.1 hypothetical protein GOEFS_044_00140 [Gordonia effusa NBRC 100432]
MSIDRSIELSSYPGTSADQGPAGDGPAQATTENTAEPVRAPKSSTHRRRWPFIASIALGLVLVLAPIVGGFFYPAAQAQAMITDFAPYTKSTTLQQFRSDLATLESVRGGVVTIDRSTRIDSADYTQLHKFVEQYPAIHADMSSMIDQIDSARGDYDNLAAIRSIAGVPFIPVGAGLVFIGLGIWGLRRGRRSGTRRVGAAIIAVAVVLGASPFLTGLVSNANSGGPLLKSLGPIMTTEKVREVQGYFVVLVGAVGDIDSKYLPAVRASSTAPAAAVAQVSGLNQRWQPMSSDFAGLIGVMNDNIKNFDGVAALDNRTRSLGFGSFAALPWLLLAAGLIGLAFGAAAISPASPRKVLST